MTPFAALDEGRILSVMPTYRCTAACRHCGTVSHPREDTWLPLDVMLTKIDEAAAAGYRLVVFTGGEATLAGEHLRIGIRRATERGLVTRVVTNAWWAEDDAAAREYVSSLRSDGLCELNLSTGDQHIRFVPLDSVVRAMAAGVDAGLPVAVMIEVVQDSTVTRETVERHPGFAGIPVERRSAISFHESPWMPLSHSRIYRYPHGQAANRDNLGARTGCDSVLSTTTIQADGRIAACCGLGMRRIPELQLGDAADMTLEAADDRARRDFLKRWLRVEGPEKILAWAASLDETIAWEDMYAHRCQACLRLYQDETVRRVIAEHHEEKIADVLFAEWLLFHYPGARSSDVEAEAG